eukprot:gene11303-7835_t
MTLNSCSAIDADPSLECQICFDTWRHPVQLDPCGHIFCAKCVTSSCSKCPSCREPIVKKREPPMEVLVAVENVRVLCGGCGWKGTRKAAEHHRCGSRDTHTELERHLERSDEEIVEELRQRMNEEGEGREDSSRVRRQRGVGTRNHNEVLFFVLQIVWDVFCIAETEDPHHDSIRALPAEVFALVGTHIYVSYICCVCCSSPHNNKSKQTTTTTTTAGRTSSSTHEPGLHTMLTIHIHTRHVGTLWKWNPYLHHALLMHAISNFFLFLFSISAIIIIFSTPRIAKAATTTTTTRSVLKLTNQSLPLKEGVVASPLPAKHTDLPLLNQMNSHTNRMGLPAVGNSCTTNTKAEEDRAKRGRVSPPPSPAGSTGPDTDENQTLEAFFWASRRQQHKINSDVNERESSILEAEPVTTPSSSSSGSSSSNMSVVETTQGVSAAPFSCSRSAPRVFYFSDLRVASIAYQQDHVMRPLRVELLQALLASLGWLQRLTKVEQPRPATATEMGVFHRQAYLACLAKAQEICAHPFLEDSLRFQKAFDVPVGSEAGDCPLFPEVWDLVRCQAGGSIACAEALLRQEADVALHFGGGMHHAAAAAASGFCFVNDIVLCIRRLLQGFLRVLYVDLDVHHGDGVEAAFAGNPRVMTLSLHQFGDGFFPGTGDYTVPSPEAHRPSRSSSAPPAGTNGVAKETPFVPCCSSSGGYDSTDRPPFAINVPLPARTGDAAYLLSFLTAFNATFEAFDPEVVVVQCGADTIAGDLIGRLCVTTHAHVACVRHMLKRIQPRHQREGEAEGSIHTSWPKKAILLGGGGYHVLHTVQCWALHTAAAIGIPETALPLYIPREDPYYMDYRQHQLGRRYTAVPASKRTRSTAGPRTRRYRYENRPLLHVELDPDVDHPLRMEESLVFYRHLCRTLPWQLKAIRRVRAGFDRLVVDARTTATTTTTQRNSASGEDADTKNSPNRSYTKDLASIKVETDAAAAPPSVSVGPLLPRSCASCLSFLGGIGLDACRGAAPLDFNTIEALTGAVREASLWMQQEKRAEAMKGRKGRRGNPRPTPSTSGTPEPKRKKLKEDADKHFSVGYHLNKQRENGTAYNNRFRSLSMLPLGVPEMNVYVCERGAAASQTKFLLYLFSLCFTYALPSPSSYHKQQTEWRKEEKKKEKEVGETIESPYNIYLLPLAAASLLPRRACSFRRGGPLFITCYGSQPDTGETNQIDLAKQQEKKENKKETLKVQLGQHELASLNSITQNIFTFNCLVPAFK